MFFHFSALLIVFKNKKINFPQTSYDSLFHSIENNLRELGFGDVAVNKKMKVLNKIFYDILLKISKKDGQLIINEKLIFKYFDELNYLKNDKYHHFERYFSEFYHFCFDIDPKIMIKQAINFKVS